MSNATKCDRCGACYEYGGMTVGEEYDLCDGCIADFEAWMERGQMADASEESADCVSSNDGERATADREHSLESESVRERRYESQDVTGDAGRVTEGGELLYVDDGGQIADMSEKSADCVRDGGEMSELEHDTREKLEADVRNVMSQWMFETGWTGNTAHGLHEHVVMRWLDRQAAITEREFFETACHGRERLGGDGRPTLDELSDELRKYTVKADRLEAALDERDDQLADARESLEAAWDDNAELKAEIATLKEHRAANVEKLHELTDECAELRKYRDEWRGLAEKYRADSIAAQAECERYRAKLGDVLDAIHEAERAAR